MVILGLRSADCSAVQKKVISKRIGGLSTAEQVWLLRVVKYVSSDLPGSRKILHLLFRTPFFETSWLDAPN